MGGVRALEWRAKMKHAPRLIHDNGMSLMQLGEDVVMFPAEADTRFFFEAYSVVPQLEEQNAHLRTQIDEGALAKAGALVAALEDAVVRLTRERDAARAQAAEQAEKAAVSTRRARLLAYALKNEIKP